MVYNQGGNLDKGKTVTNSFIIAENAGITHKAVKNQIVKRKKELESFGRVVLKIQPMKTLGGEQEVSFYELNEQQATLLFTFLRNTEQVIKFKVTLVRAFYTMRDDLVKRKETRDLAKIDRSNLTKSICDSGEQERMHNRGIPNYTNLIYKSIFGMNKKKLIEGRGLNYNKDMNTREFLNEDEIEQVRLREGMVSQLLDFGYDYSQIKNILKVK